MSETADLAGLAWLEGRWVGEGLGGIVEECYSAPAGGQMVGYFRLVRDGQPVFYELIVVAQAGPSIEYRVKHFEPDLRGWEARDEHDCFHLIDAQPGLWVFDKAMIRDLGENANEQAVRDSPHHEWSGFFRYHRA